MNNLLELKKNFFSMPNTGGGFGEITLPPNSTVTLEHLAKLRDELSQICAFWSHEHLLEGALISVHYRRVIPKSRRVSRLLGVSENAAFNSVRGVKLEKLTLYGKSRLCHVITHFLQKDKLDLALKQLKQVLKIAGSCFPSGIDTLSLKRFCEAKDSPAKLKQLFAPAENDLVSVRMFNQIVIDAFFVRELKVDRFELPAALDEAIITFFETGKSLPALLASLEVELDAGRMLSKTTALLRASEIEQIIARAPYLISMAVSNLRSLEEIYTGFKSEMRLTLPAPQSEPVIGVIDTPFNSTAYCRDWVDNRQLVDPLSVTENNAAHGTAVTSLIVDGPGLNPELDDHCGYFRVRHFGVMSGDTVNSFELIRTIRRIIQENRDITVWNLSLGSPREVSENFISVEAFELDKLQNEYNVIFIIAGTNRPPFVTAGDYRIGAPADAVNALTVNSVGFSGAQASYSRCGPVLHYLKKPDVAYYGGESPRRGSGEHPLTVCIRGSETDRVWGTSFAAPWVTRKVAYLIHHLHLPREVVKALLIHKASDFNSMYQPYLGFGIVPQDINAIVHSRDDEITFYLSVDIRDYSTYVYDLPVPKKDGKFPYVAHLTAAYVSPVNRDQGIDYSDVELAVKFGRVKLNPANDKVTLVNLTNPDAKDQLTEEEERTLFAKWDNVKDFKEKLSSRSRAKTAYHDAYGLQITAKYRKKAQRPPLRCGIVVTLREINGLNRIGDFVKACQINAYMVNELNVAAAMQLNAEMSEDVYLET